MKNLFRFFGILAILTAVHFGSHAQTTKYKVYRIGDDVTVVDSAGTKPITMQRYEMKTYVQGTKVIVTLGGARFSLSKYQFLDKDGIPYDSAGTAASALLAYNNRNAAGFYKIPATGTSTTATATGTLQGAGVLYWKIKNVGAAACTLQLKNSKTGANVGAAFSLDAGATFEDQVKEVGGYMVDAYTVTYTIGTATTLSIVTKTRP